MNQKHPALKTDLIIGRLEAMEPVAILEGARVTAAPFSVAELNKAQGHDPNFLGSDTPTPFPRPAHAADLQAVNEGLVRTLDYTHFSILFDARKKQALATVVDIDGRYWKGIKRRGGDVWYPDPRMSAEDQPQSRHFSKPDPRIDPEKNQFAFGHLVRRLDPCWDPPGSTGVAEIAELQSFFLTNASPQAEDLNEGIWNNLEDLVLNDLTRRLKIRAVVISGPLFDDKQRVRIHDEMPVAAQYFKIVAWKSEGRVAAVGWVQRQPDGMLPPILESINPFEEPDAKGKRKPSLIWLKPIAEIAAMASLDLSAYEAGDTYGLRKPKVGLETVFAEFEPVARSADDLLLTGALPLDDQEEPSAQRALGMLLAYREREEADPSIAARPEAAAAEAIRETRVSERAYKLIVNYETGGRKYYETKYKKRPVWPKEASGITIGFGYDLGYVTAAEFERDWTALHPADLATLRTTIGMKGKRNSDAEMLAALARVKGVVIEWELAERVFRAATLPKFEALTTGALPNIASVSGDSFGALVSLTFNRGASYSRHPKPGERDRWIQMRGIRAAMEQRSFGAIPALIRDMIPLWHGTDIELGMTRRRTDEAVLFQAGLAGTREAVASPGAGIARTEASPAAVTEFAGEREQDDAQKWPDSTDENIARDAAAVPLLETTGVAWAPDRISPDYSHLAQPPGIGLTYSLVAADLELLAVANGFAVDGAGDRILFGLRGAMIVTDQTNGSSITLKDLRPDHDTPRCVIGVWNRTASTVAVFPASTVPNAAAVRHWHATHDSGNMLPTGLYGYVTGAHNGKPGCFLLRETIAKKRTVIVRRSSDDLTYDLGDLADLCAPGDNIHPTFRSNLASFSSVGCQTVVGVATLAGAHSGPWASFRTAADLPKPDGTAYTYMLLTGAEARLASEIRRNGLAGDAISTARLRRLRFGSRGAAVTRLQQKLGLDAADGVFGPTTAMRLHARQRIFPGSQGSDGIYTPAFDQALGWAVFEG